MRDSNTTILRAVRGGHNGIVNACRFLAKTGGPKRASVLLSGDRVGLGRAGVGMTRRRTAIATEWLTPVDSLQKQAAPRCVHTLRSPGMSKEYRLNSMTIKNSEEQRETAKNSQPRRCFFDASLSKTQGFLRRRAG